MDMVWLSFQVFASPLRRLGQEDVRGACRAAGNGVAELVRAHLRGLPGRGFWRDAADATRVAEVGEDVEVWIERRGVGLQFYGGTVLPGRGMSSFTGRPTRLLAIPTSREVSEAPGRYGPLVFVPLRRGHLRGLLLPGVEGVARRSGRRHRRGDSVLRAAAGAAPLFRLVDQTHHVPHAFVLPPQLLLHRRAVGEVARFLRVLR